MNSSTSCEDAATASPPEPTAHPHQRGRTAGLPTLLAALAGSAAIRAGTQAAGWEPEVAGALTALVALVVVGGWISVIDLREHRIPNRLTLALAGALTVAGYHDPGSAALGALAMLGAYLVLHLIAQLGAGDVKLAAACGLALGVQGPGALVTGFCAGFFLALPAALWHVVRRRHTHVAFGPWLIAGTILVLAASLPG